MTLYNIFSTKEEADAAQEEDFSVFSEAHVDNPKYLEQTTQWDTVTELVGGGWGYRTYPLSRQILPTAETEPVIIIDNTPSP